MAEKLVDDVIMEIHHRIELVTPLAADANPSSTVCRVKLPDATGKVMSMIITTRLNKYQQFKDIHRYNNYGRHIHRRRDQDPAISNRSGGG